MRIITNTSWVTPRTLFVLAFLGCIVFAHAATNSSGVDPRFDRGSASLARNWQNVKAGIPHGKIPDSAEKIKDVGSWGMDYGIGLAKVVGPGFAIAILTLLAGVVYGIFKLFRCCFCHLCKNKDEEEDSDSDTSCDEDARKRAFKKVWCPTLAYAIAWIFLLTGMIFGLMNNPRFSNGISDMGDSVIGVGHDAIGLGNGLISNVTSIARLVPSSINEIIDQFDGVVPLADDVTVLSDDINGTSSQISNITEKIGAIDAGSNGAVSSLYTELAAINNQSQQIVSQMAELTNRLAIQLVATFNDTVGSLDSKTGEINETVGELEDTAREIIDQASDVVDMVSDTVTDVKGYDKKRGSAVLALFVVVIIVTFLLIIGYVVKFKFIFNIIAALSFVFLFFLWFSGSIHFLLGMALYDACPIIDVAVQGMLPADSQGAAVLRGCLYEDRSVFDSMNITAYNLSEVFDYKTEFQSFASFSESFNFSSVDSYFDSINNLYSYNLTAEADNITAANFGWNETKIYDILAELNEQTDPLVYNLDDYTTANQTAYPPPKDEVVQGLINNITFALEANQTVYAKIDEAKQQMYDAQKDIDILCANMTQLRARYDGIRNQTVILQTQNITNCIHILDNLQGNITGFFELGNCSFLGEAYVEIRTSLCETMQPAIDCLTVAQFLAGLALIPIAILAEFLSFHVPKNRVRPSLPCGGNDHDDDDLEKNSYKKEQKRGGGYAVAMTDSPMVNRRLTGITATVSATASTDSSAEPSPAPSPDFGSSRRVIADHFENHD